MGRNIEIVCLRNDLGYPLVKPVYRSNRAWFADIVDGWQYLEITGLNILRAITKRLTHLDLETALPHRRHLTIQAIAPASRVFDTEQSHVHAWGQIFIQRIAKKIGRDRISNVCRSGEFRKPGRPAMTEAQGHPDLSIEPTNNKGSCA